MSIADIITAYKSAKASAVLQENVELELRFKGITKDIFAQVIDAVKPKHKPALHCSVNIIADSTDRTQSGEKLIRTLEFSKGVKTEDYFVRKSQITRPVVAADYLKYTINLEKESAEKPFTTSNNAMIRFKARLSFEIRSDEGSLVQSAPVWRLDMTAIKTGIMQELGPNLSDIRNALFKPTLTADNYLTELNFDMIDRYEMELELISGIPTPDDVQDVAKMLFSLINPQYLTEVAYNDEIYHVAKHIIDDPQLTRGKYGIKRLSNNVISVTKNDYYRLVYPAVGYYLTDKADGVRTIISIMGTRCRLLTSAGFDEITIGSGDQPEAVTIADAEMVTIDGRKHLYVFDCMVCDGVKLAKEPFTTRLGRIPQSVEIINRFIKGSDTGAQYAVAAKEFSLIEEGKLEQVIKEVWDTERPYEIDGLIFTSPGESYTDTRSYKWKPTHTTTIDFLAVKCPQKLLGIKPYEVRQGKTLYLLFVGINKPLQDKLGLTLIPHYRSIFGEAPHGYYPIQFSPSVNPYAYLLYDASPDLDRKIVELQRASPDGPFEWKLMRIRDDRQLEKNYFGNDFRVAELTYINYIDPFELQDLWKPNSSYFNKSQDDIHFAPNKVKRFAISALLKDNFSGAKWIIDEAAGRGADQHRYREIGVENALFIDIDATAISELIRRKFEYITKQAASTNDRHNASKPISTYAMVANLKTPADQLVAQIEQFGAIPGIVDGIVCNFAFHYFCDDVKNIRNVLKFNHTMMKVGGLFIFTVMNGARVFERLKGLKTGESWKVMQDNVVKYHIVKKYSGDKLTAAGQNIGILLPFSDELYDEPLCNIDEVIKEARKLGYEYEHNHSFSSYLDRIKSVNAAIHSRLTPDDLEYIDMFSYVSLRKVSR